jgi:mannosyltransferase
VGRVPVAGAVLLATVVSVLLRTGDLHAGFWIDEGIAVGIAQHGFTEIPGVLRVDGSPPLYYLLLHGWLALTGDGEAVARSLSLLFAAVLVPASWWAGNAIAGRRAGVAAVAIAACCPVVSYYAQEARMYTLVALLSVIAAAAFVLAFTAGRRAHLVTLGVATVLLLYTHNWGLFLVAAMTVVWLGLWRRGKVSGRDGALLAAAVALAYVPWLPTLVFQMRHTGAPWSSPPSLLVLGTLTAALALAARGVLARVAAIGLVLGWLIAQVEPSWSPRYLLVLYGPVVLATARRPAWVLPLAVGMLLVPLPAKSNARAVAVSAGIGLRPGDLVISTQPEQVPVLERYLPRGVVYLTPLGRPHDPSVMDWRDALRRLQTGPAPRPHLRQGRRIVLVTPVGVRSRAPWGQAVRARTRAWRVALSGDPRLCHVGATSHPDPTRYRSTVRAEIFTVCRPPRA